MFLGKKFMKIKLMLLMGKTIELLLEVLRAVLPQAGTKDWTHESSPGVIEPGRAWGGVSVYTHRSGRSHCLENVLIGQTAPPFLVYSQLCLPFSHHFESW